MFYFPFLSIRVSNLKCFGDTPQGFDCIKSVNVVIGRNNTGKTALLDSLRFALQPSTDLDLCHLGKEPQAIISLRLTNEVRSYLLQIPYINQHITYFKDFARHNDQVSWQRRPGQSLVLVRDGLRYSSDNQIFTSILHQVLLSLDASLQTLRVISVAADRDISVESDENPLSPSQADDMSPAGVGATRIIQRMLKNQDHTDRDLIQNVILAELNCIYGPDGQFKRHVCRSQNMHNKGSLGSFSRHGRPAHGSPCPDG